MVLAVGVVFIFRSHFSFRTVQPQPLCEIFEHRTISLCQKMPRTSALHIQRPCPKTTCRRGQPSFFIPPRPYLLPLSSLVNLVVVAPCICAPTSETFSAIHIPEALGTLSLPFGSSVVLLCWQHSTLVLVPHTRLGSFVSVEGKSSSVTNHVVLLSFLLQQEIRQQRQSTTLR